MKTYLLLDINGVFDPYLAENLPENFIHFKKEWASWRIDVLNHAAWLRKIEPHVNIVWASNWEDFSNEISKMFLLDRFDYPYIHFNKIGSTETWKLDSVKNWYEQSLIQASDKIIWVDDELYDDAFKWEADNNNILLIKTNPAIGLEESQMKTIEDCIS